jgi:hypothetical protein
VPTLENAPPVERTSYRRPFVEWLPYLFRRYWIAVAAFAIPIGCIVIWWSFKGVDAMDFHTDYIQHPKEFRAKYAGKRVTVSGRVVEAGSSFGQRYLILGTADKQGRLYVQFISPSDADRAGGCSRVTVCGTVSILDGDTIFLVSSDLVWGN